MDQSSYKVLLIEDDEDDYVLTSHLLNEIKQTKYDITWISKYSECLPIMVREEHDVCLIDYRLGEETGIALVREAIAAGCLLPMILLTGQGDSEIDLEATEAGAADYLVKGEVEPLLLERSIRYALARSKLLETLSVSEKRFRSVVESAKDAIILTGGRGEILSWNNAAQLIFGYTFGEVKDQPFSSLFAGADPDIHSTSAGLDSMIASGLLHPESKAVETTGLRKGGDEFPIEISISSWETAQGTFCSAIIRDVTERKSLEKQLTYQALHDPLTKLANRVLFGDRVSHALKRLDRNRSSASVLFLDLDNFKTVNDTLGHSAGDDLLVAVAGRLQSCLRGSDTAARLGGDEFAVLIEDSAAAEGALFVAERIKEVLQFPFTIEGKEMMVGSSIGIATTTASNETAAELLRNADVAMYTAKNGGKGRYAVFEPDMQDAVVASVELEAEIRAGIENGEFVLNYQPIMTLQSDQIVGMEALIRWRHPVRGMLSPDEFIPVAEDSKLIQPLGHWMLEEACAQAASWQERFDMRERLSITVNISSRQFQDNELVSSVRSALETSGLSPQSLILEMTENTMLQDTNTTIGRLNMLKDLGVRIAIDDFGAGYSSLCYLERFPVDVLKIDKSFISKLDSGSEGSAVARALITMSNAMHLHTIAAGIESMEQIGTLNELGCKLGQGVLFAKPLSGDDMYQFLLDNVDGGMDSYLQNSGRPHPAVFDLTASPA